MRRFLGHLRGGRLSGTPTPERHGALQVQWRGWIANRADLQRTAVQRGVRLCGNSDGELFAQAWQWWGEELQARVHGEYSVALFDEQLQTLVLTHDALGLLPLFYQAGAQELVWASSLEDLVGEVGFDDFDKEYLADYLARSASTGSRTPFRGLQRVRAEHTVIVKRGRLEERRTWSLADVPPLPVRDTQEAVDRLQGLLREGVRSALESSATASAPAWVECSGGLDSSTVTCLAAESGTRRLAAVSTVFEKCRQADESKWTQLVVDHCGVPWHKVDGDVSLPFAELPHRFCAEPGLPMIDWGWRRRYDELLEANDVQTLLTGQGGDLVLQGPGTEPFHLADLLLRPGQLFPELARWQRQDGEHRSSLYWLLNLALRPALRFARGQTLRRTQRQLSPWIRQDYARSMQLSARAEKSLEQRGTGIGNQWFREHLAAVCGLVANLNQIPEHFEYRHPLLYRPLVEFMYSVPWGHKIAPGTDRLLQREALRNTLPEKVRVRKSKAVMDQPIFEGLRQGRAWLDLLTRAPRLIERGIVDAQRWDIAVAQARMGQTFHLPQFEAACTLEIWLRQFDRLSRAPSTATERSQQHEEREAAACRVRMPIESGSQ